MKLQDLYYVIKPLNDIIINKYLKEKIDFLNNIITAINAKSSDHAAGMAEDGSGLSLMKCTWIYKIYYYLLLLIFFICFFWIIKDIYQYQLDLIIH